MNRAQVEHVLRAAAAIAQELTFFVVGSQAIVLLVPDAPQELRASCELDLYPANAPEKADLIDGAIGALSSFDATFGYYADGVGPETAVMPDDWRTRERLFYFGEVTAICPEIHDLAVSKCAAGREKDADFVRALLRHQLIEENTLLARIDALNPQRVTVAVVRAWAQRRIVESKSSP
jgi:hypothetical protein